MRGTQFAELSAFVAVAEHGNFSRAAVALGIVPSTLSQTIRALEERLGVRLLHRTTRSVSLTEAGERMLERVRPAFEELNRAVEAINDFRDTPMGMLRLSVSSIPAHMILAPLMKKFLKAYPAIRLEITVDDTTSDIVKGRFDAGIRYGRRIEKNMHLIRASRESRLIAVAAPEYLARHPTPKTPEDLHGHTCILFRRDNQEIITWEFEKGRKKTEISVNGPLIVNDVDLMVRAARDGIGIGYMVESYLEEYIRQGKLVPLLLDWSPAHHSYYLYYTSRRQLSVPLKAFIVFLRANVD